MATLYKPVYAKFLTAYRGVHRGTERLSSHSLEAAVRTEGNPSTPTPGPLRALQGGQDHLGLLFLPQMHPAHSPFRIFVTVSLSGSVSLSPLGAGQTVPFPFVVSSPLDPVRVPVLFLLFLLQPLPGKTRCVLPLSVY